MATLGSRAAFAAAAIKRLSGPMSQHSHAFQPAHIAAITGFQRHAHSRPAVPPLPLVKELPKLPLVQELPLLPYRMDRDFALDAPAAIDAPTEEKLPKKEFHEAAPAKTTRHKRASTGGISFRTAEEGVSWRIGAGRWKRGLATDAAPATDEVLALKEQIAQQVNKQNALLWNIIPEASAKSAPEREELAVQRKIVREAVFAIRVLNGWDTLSDNQPSLANGHSADFDPAPEITASQVTLHTARSFSTFTTDVLSRGLRDMLNRALPGSCDEHKPYQDLFRNQNELDKSLAQLTKLESPRLTASQRRI